MRVLDQLPRVAELSRSAVRQAGSFARSAGRFATDQLRRRRGDDGDESGPSTTASTPAEAAPPAPAPTPAEPPAPPPTPAESADADTTEGPGPQVHVDEPWKGYGELNAKQAIGELGDRSAETLAVARLYEIAHRNRRTVLAEIDRRLDTAGG